MKPYFKITLSMLLIALLVLYLAWYLWPLPRNLVYTSVRELARRRALSSPYFFTLKHESRHFVLRCTGPDADVADMVLEAAEWALDEVSRDLGYMPRGKIPVLMYHTRSQLRRSLGPAGNLDAMGIYWAGSIKLLSPKAWTSSLDPGAMARELRETGPMVHEISHLVLDYLTNGNYPRWFTEGVAQYEEFRIMGYLWAGEEGGAAHVYDLKELESRFDSLPDQSHAYRQSFMIVSYLAERYGPGTLEKIIDALGRGRSMPEALKEVTGKSYGEFEREFGGWFESISFPAEQE